MKSITFILKTCFITAILFVYGCDSLVRDYELDLDADLLKDITLLQFIEEGNDTTLTIYYEAVKYANLESIISNGKQTRIVPNNVAMRSLLNSIGVSNVTDFPPNVLKNLFMYLIVPQEFKALSFESNVLQRYQTLSGDSLFVRRNDRYNMTINPSGGFNPASVPILKQDYVFKDGIAQVVEVFPVYRRNVLQPDPEPANIDYTLAEKDTIWISEDASVYAASKAANYGTVTSRLVPRSGQQRYSFMKFASKPISFLDDLVSAKLNFDVMRITGAFVPLCGVYEVASDWSQTTLTWNLMPPFGAEVASSTLVLGWNAIDVTSYIKRMYDQEMQVGAYGFKLLNGADVPSSYVEIYHRESTVGGKPNISLMSAIPTELSLDVSVPVTIHATGEIALLLKENLSMSAQSATYSYVDKNIIYVLVVAPLNGTLTNYGLPMRKNDRFTQHDIAVGAVKYIGNDTVVNDAFELKVQDYIGGVYHDLIQVLVR